MEEITSAVVIIALGLFGYYFREKAKNLATREDIGEITKKVEEIKNIYKKYYDLSKTEREFYDQMVKITQKFLTKIKRYELDKGTGENSVTKKVIEGDSELHNSFLLFIDNANEVLAKAFVFLGEESYQRLKDSLRKNISFAKIRFNLLAA
ncbi:MAG: hypothetical protein ABIH35_04135, partial [Patescibacteria group bacterium]